MFAVAAAVVAADQLTKWWALQRLSGGRSIHLVWTLQLDLAFNTGAAFSMGGSYGALIGLVAVGVVLYLLWQSRSASTRVGAVAMGLLLGGALGNLLDRVFRAGDGPFSGAVVDFIDLQWFPVFNLADASLTIGVILLVVWMLWDQVPEGD